MPSNCPWRRVIPKSAIDGIPHSSLGQAYIDATAFMSYLSCVLLTSSDFDTRGISTSRPHQPHGALIDAGSTLSHPPTLGMGQAYWSRHRHCPKRPSGQRLRNRVRTERAGCHRRDPWASTEFEMPPGPVSVSFRVRDVSYDRPPWRQRPPIWS